MFTKEEQKAMDLTVIIIKPDAVRDILESQIISDFCEKVDFQILFAKYHQFSDPQVISLYPDWVDKSVFPFMVKNLTMGKSLVLLVRGEESSKKIAAVKGKMNIGGGLRNKYCKYTVDQMIDMGYTEYQINQLKAENRMHSTDTDYEALEVINIICSNHELLMVSKYFTGSFLQTVYIKE